MSIFLSKLEAREFIPERMSHAAVSISNPIIPTAKKVQHLEQMSTGSDAVLVYLRLGYKGQEIDGRLYQRLAMHTVAIGKQVGGLRKYLATAAP